MDDPLGVLADVLGEAEVDYALIGGHAVNAWVEPRFTALIDVTIAADASDLKRVKITLKQRGFSIAVEYGSEQSSGPDFIRFTSSDSTIVLEFQFAKTRLHEDLIGRARHDSRGLRIAPERVNMPPSQAWLSCRYLQVVQKRPLVIPIRSAEFLFTSRNQS